MPARPSASQVAIAAPAVTLAGAALLFGQVMYTAHRDLPSYPNQDPSGRFGDPALPTLRVVALGDSSITAPGVVDLDNTWLRATLRRLTDRYEIDLRSVAVGGAKVGEVRRDQLGKALALKPDLAVVSAGANDALRTLTLRDFERDFHEIVAALHRAADAVVIQGIGDLSTAPRLPNTFNHYTRRRAQRIDAVITEIALAYPRAVRIPAWGRVSDAFRSGERAHWAGDLFHASDAGHLLFVPEAAPVFEAALQLRDARLQAASARP